MASFKKGECVKMEMDGIKDLKQEDIYRAFAAELYLTERRRIVIRSLRRIGVRIRDVELEDIISS